MKETAKTLEARKYVESFISEHKYAPTYEQVALALSISKTSAFHRCRNIRDLMGNEKKSETLIKFQVLIPHEKLKEFNEWMLKMPELNHSSTNAKETKD